MTFAEALPYLTTLGRQIYKQSEPLVYYELDAAEDLTIWCYDGNSDTLTQDRRFGVHDLVATDWTHQ